MYHFFQKNDGVNYFYFDIEVNLSRPTISSIKMYNVTDKGDEHTDTSELITDSLNTTIDLEQDMKYRFDVNISVDSNWTLGPDDEISIKGLNRSWEINNETDIWISNQTGSSWSGGNFTDGKIIFNMSKEGYVTEERNLTFHFIINSTGKLDERQIHIFINNTGAESEDYSTYHSHNPELKVELITPADNTIIGQNKTVIVNASCRCNTSFCGTIIGFLRYNGTATTPDTEVPDTDSKPMYVMEGSNPDSCSDISEGEYCNISYELNMTGDLRDSYEIDVEFKAENADNNDTTDSTVSIEVVLIIGLGYNEVNFGIQDPGTGMVAGTNNTIGYNITVDNESNNIENLWVKSTNLTHEDNIMGPNGTGVYRITTDSVLWSLGTDPYPDPSVYNLSEDYQRVNKDMSEVKSGTNETLYFWVDIPGGILSGNYFGTLTIMANQSW